MQLTAPLSRACEILGQSHTGLGCGQWSWTERAIHEKAFSAPFPWADLTLPQNSRLPLGRLWDQGL